MKEIETGFIEKVIDIMNNNGLTEVTLEDNDKSLYIRKDSSIAAPVIEQKPAECRIEAPEKENEPEKKLTPVVSNMIGIFFIKPSPDSGPFVKIGSRVKKGQPLCIIETIKLMNNVVSEVSGTVKEICIEDGQPVEYGQTIMYIEQD